MPLTVTERKVKLLEHDVRLADIGRELKVSRQAVHRCIAGLSRSRRIREALAKAMGTTVRRAFG